MPSGSESRRQSVLLRHSFKSTGIRRPRAPPVTDGPPASLFMAPLSPWTYLSSRTQLAARRGCGTFATARNRSFWHEPEVGARPRRRFEAWENLGVRFTEGGASAVPRLLLCPCGLLLPQSYGRGRVRSAFGFLAAGRPEARDRLPRGSAGRGGLHGGPSRCERRHHADAEAPSDRRANLGSAACTRYAVRGRGLLPSGGCPGEALCPPVKRSTRCCLDL
jgi:hypothetical protein